MLSFAAKLQRCREEREKIIREETLAHASRSRTVDPRKNFLDSYLLHS